jgi:hypothetical protein
MPTPRHLTPDDQNKMREVLEKAAGTKYRLVMTGEEAGNFGSDIDRAFISAHWVSDNNFYSTSGSIAIAGLTGKGPFPSLYLAFGKDSAKVEIVREAFRAVGLDLPSFPGTGPLGSEWLTGPQSLDTPDIAIGIVSLPQ